MAFHPILGVSAPERGRAPAPRYLLRRDRILDLIDGLPRGHLLEVGCGAGALLADFCLWGSDARRWKFPDARRLLSSGTPFVLADARESAAISAKIAVSPRTRGPSLAKIVARLPGHRSEISPGRVWTPRLANDRREPGDAFARMRGFVSSMHLRLNGNNASTASSPSKCSNTSKMT